VATLAQATPVHLFTLSPFLASHHTMPPACLLLFQLKFPVVYIHGVTCHVSHRTVYRPPSPPSLFYLRVPDAELSQPPSGCAEPSRVPCPLAMCSFLLIALRPRSSRRRSEPLSRHTSCPPLIIDTLLFLVLLICVLPGLTRATLPCYSARETEDREVNKKLCELR
jgi:hypothetical protein